jgi:hypothetical protein
MNMIIKYPIYQFVSRRGWRGVQISILFSPYCLWWDVRAIEGMFEGSSKSDDVKRLKKFENDGS